MYDWYEYAHGDCSYQDCRVHALNFEPSQPENPRYESDYVARLVDVGLADGERMALSYFDQENGAYGVGTRVSLSTSARDGDQQRSDCEAAFMNMQNIREKYVLPLRFPLENPCDDGLDKVTSPAQESQVVL